MDVEEMVNKSSVALLAILIVVLALVHGSYYFRSLEEFEHSYVIRDPTYADVRYFVMLDRTNEDKYDEKPSPSLPSTYYRVADFKSNAFEEGYRCGYAQVLFPDGRAMSLIVFTTTDRSLVYVLPESDNFVEIVVGEPFWEGVEDVLYDPPWNDTVIELVTIW